MRRALVISGIVLAGILVIFLAAFAYVCVPWTPGRSAALSFRGFVVLPKKQTFDQMDYVTVHGPDVFVTDVTGGTVYKVKVNSALPKDSKISELAGVPGCHGVVIDPVSGLAFVTSSGANAVDVFDPATMQLKKKIPVPRSPDAIAYDPIDRLVYAPSGEAQKASVIDPVTQTVRSTIRLGGDTEAAAYDPQGQRLYQNLSDQNAVAVLNIAKGVVIGRVPLPGCSLPTGLTVDSRGRRLFVVCAKSSKLLVLDIASGLVATAVPISFGGDAVAYDPGLHRIYVTGLLGTMTVVQQDTPNKYHVIDAVGLAFNAHTVAVDPSTHEVFVAYGGYIAAPRLAVFRALSTSK